MSPSELSLLHVLHVASVVTLIAFTFYGFAAAPNRRKLVLITTGISALIVLLTGIRMWQGMYAFHGGWVIVKLVCWLALSGLAGIGFRKRDQTGLFMTIILAIAVIALVMVYYQPWA